MREQFAPGRGQWTRAWFGVVVVAPLIVAACGEESDPDITVNVTEAPAGGTAVATTVPAYGGY
jgi:hypothetical protein